MAVVHRWKPDEIERIFKSICEKVATGEHTIKSCITNEAVPEKQFYRWLERDIEKAKEENRESWTLELYRAAKKKATQKYKTDLCEKARTGLQKAISGYEYEETKIVATASKEKDADGNNKPGQVKEITKIKKYVGPNVTAIIFALTNTDPDNFKHKRDLMLDVPEEIKSKLAVIKLDDGTEIPV